MFKDRLDLSLHNSEINQILYQHIVSANPTP